METLDGTLLSNMKQWQCENNEHHVLGVIERVEVIVNVEGSTLRYHTSRLILFRQAVDIDALIPAKIDVAGKLDVKMLSKMNWNCSLPGCGCSKAWHPDKEVLEYLTTNYHAE